MSDTARMIRALYENAVGAFVEVRALPAQRRSGPRQAWFALDDVDSVVEHALSLAETHDVYVGVAPRRTRAGGKAAIDSVQAIWADIDTPEAVVELATFELPPSLVVTSGSPGCYHAYWLLHKPVDVATAESLLPRVARRLHADERVKDASRILRVAGTLNHKHQPPTSVRLEQHTNARYTAEEIEAALPEAVDAPQAAVSAAASSGEPAEPVAAVLDRLMEVRKSSNGWTARCPAHHDEHPSLSVAQGQDGRCLLHCHADCKPADVVAALGLTLADLFARDHDGHERSLAAILVGLAEDAGVELFHDSLDQALVVAPVNDHREVWRVESRTFKRWLRLQLRTQRNRTAGAQPLNDAIELLAAQAQFDGPEQEVFVRVANVGDTVYLDLGDPSWRVVEVRAGSWQVVERSPVPFVRRPSTLALPDPIRGRRLDELRRFINAPDDADWRLIVSFLIAALAGLGPFPLLVLLGEQGSAKTTTARVLRRLVDPVKAMLRAGAPDERDLMIAATGQWLVGFDNVSRLTERLADALCQLSTGAGFATRQLYTDADEVVFEAMRPAILNGIAGLSHRGDFLSRAILLELPQIPEDRRQMEAHLWEAFEEVRPQILGALLDVLAGVLEVLPDLRLERAPRLADFARVGCAVERVCGWPAGSFLQALDTSQSGGLQDALDAEPVAAVLVAFAEKHSPWAGTMTQLLNGLNAKADDDVKRQRGWPPNAAQLGVRLKRLAPALRAAGVQVENKPAGRGKDKRRGIQLRHEAPSPSTREAVGGDGGDGGDGDSPGLDAD